MNRPIKFRGLRTVNNEWIYGDLCTQGKFHDAMIGVWDKQSGQCEWYPVLPETVGQFTGKTDNWNKEIWEGDRVKILYTDWPSKPDSDPRTLDQYLDDISMKATVIFIDGAFELQYSSGSYGSIHPGPHGFIKVIGSIHTHPELLSNTQVK